MTIPLPNNLEISEAKGNKATIAIEPCYPGYGVTLGNSLRRVLLSSIDGAAITSIRIEGSQHEFSSLPDVKEDVMEIVLNVKRIRLKVFSEEPVLLKLNVSGEKVVKAGDLAKNADVEIASPEAVIATLTSKDAKLEMEFMVQRGRGYVTVEDRSKEKVDVGWIMVDAFYSPVVAVGFEIENIRVGDRTDYERLLLKMETDGTMSPKEVLEKASEILVNHFSFILNETVAGSEKKKKAKAEAEAEVLISETAPSKEESDKVQAAGEAESKKKRGRPKKTDK
ncbi:MAG TPA: DNA-directed RNA polymerase subunit alpha [Patescibacteria group bacterium]|nr:DNA-directed RNA polymerase subunit alpha [Patescibacteria group bacterium]